MPSIAYTPEQFPPSTGKKLRGRRSEHFAWAEIVHAAMTVGRRSWGDVLRHSSYSVLEMLWRIALVRSNLRGTKTRLAPTAAYRALDRSEKGGVSFFLGLCVVKLFAERLFGVPWLLHLDVYRAQINPTFATAERPDFVGQDPSGRWIVLEAKGRSGGAPTTLLNKAKSQTQSLTTVAGVNPTLRVALAAYFSSGLLRARIVDPSDADVGAVPLSLNPEQFGRAYYSHVFDFIKTLNPSTESRNALVDASVTGTGIPGMDAIVLVSEQLARWYLLEEGSWDDVVARARIPNMRTPLARFELLAATSAEERPALLSRLERTERRSLRRRVEQSSRDAEDSPRFAGDDQVTVSLGQSWTDEVMRREPGERAG